MSAEDKAAHLLAHYLRFGTEAAGKPWDGDNDTECELIVDYILAAAGQRFEQLEARVKALEADTPQARQMQYEADVAAADLAESGYDRHGRDCNCPYCATDEDEETQ